MPERESRVVEYKAGGGNYTTNILPAHINKYGSAFLNSSGGTLCIGVNDDGNVPIILILTSTSQGYASDEHGDSVGIGCHTLV